MAKKADPKTLDEVITRLVELEAQVLTNALKIEELKHNVRGEWPVDPPIVTPD